MILFGVLFLDLQKFMSDFFWRDEIVIVTFLNLTAFFFFFLFISLHDGIHIPDYLLCQIIGLFLHIAFSVYPDDRFGIGFS